ncbi:Gaa1-like protein [Lipomyces arxii]|uniref:Gaa1-like protein n=1 Tax=Lipomyces arxii TaxID=56418 RepID=UPI0034CD996B
MTVLQTIRRQLIGSKNASDVLSSLLPGLSAILILAGIAWLLILPLEDQSRRTYISENALLPGQALTYFHGSEENIVRAFREEIRNLKNVSEEARAEKVKQWLTDIGYKSSTHEWSASHYDDVKSGINTYGVLHAPRGDTTESMIICAPWINGDGVMNEGGVAISIALARYMARWSIWSKDIILLISSDAGFGISKWIEDYHYTSMPVSSGSIQGGIVVDFPSQGDRFESLDLIYTGFNGNLPNLDLVNTVVLVAGHMSAKITIHNISDNEETYLSRANTLFDGIAQQALSGLYKTGAGNEAFSGWRIDTVTLRASVTEDGSGQYDQMLYGRMVEATMRSINNLLEHFHQSFFFYLLLAPKRFVSIGTYLPSAMLIGASFTIKGISFWFKSTQSAAGASFIQAAHAFGLFSIIIFASIALFAIVAWIPSQELAKLVYTIAAFTACFPLLIQSILVKKPLSYINKLRAYSLIYAGLFLTTLSTIDFSLALLLGLIFAPLGQLLTPSVKPVNIQTKSQKLKGLVFLELSRISIIITCPWLTIFCYFRFMVTESNFPDTWLDVDFLRELALSTSYARFNEFLSSMMWNWRALGVWTTMPVLFVVWLPLWTISCVIVSVPTFDDMTVANSSNSEEPVKAQ